MKLRPRIRGAFHDVLAHAAHVKDMMPRRHPKQPYTAPAPSAHASEAADAAPDRYGTFKLLADCLPELVFYIDAEQVCRAHNNAVQETLGWPAHALDERPLRDILGEASYDCVKAYVARVLAGEEARLRQLHRDRDGRLLGFDARYVPHRGANDRILGFCALLTPEPGGARPWLLSRVPGAPVPGSREEPAAEPARGEAREAAAARDEQADEQALAQFRAALQAERFRLFQQPIVPLGGGAKTDAAPDVTSFEVLLRLRDEDGRVIHPGAFLRRAEEVGFMRELDRWVIERVWQWLSRQPRAWRIHVNLSTDSVCDAAFPKFVTGVVGTDRIKAGSLCFEIAEDTLLQHRMTTLACAHALRMLGCRVALDRFRGASGSFSVMLDMPVDCVKIDSSLVVGLVGDSHSATKVKIIATLARSMGAASIAERVEDPQTREALIRIGVDCAQGFGIAIPEALENP